MSPGDVVLALDQGSGSSRVLAFDSRGRVAARAQFPIKTRYPGSGLAELDAEEILRSSERALRAVVARLGRKLSILGLGIAAQRSTLIVWDARTAKALGPALSWQDARAVAEIRPLQARPEEVFETTGLLPTPYYSAPKLRWLLDHWPKARQAMEAGALRAGPIPTYLLWRWTHGESFAIDPTMAQRMLLLDLGTLDWSEKLLEAFRIPREILPSVTPTSGDWAILRGFGRRDIRVGAVLGDQQSAAMGLDCRARGSGIVNYGTGAFALIHTGTERPAVRGLLTSAAWQRDGESCRHFIEGTVNAAGVSFDWLKDNLGLIKDIGRVEAMCRKSRQRVMVLPAFGGLGAPRWDFSATVAFLGMDGRTHAEDLVRGVAEGIAFLVSDIAHSARAAGIEVEKWRAAGGLSRLDYLMQFQADILQTPVERSEDAEATARGAAYLAAEQAGASWAGSLLLKKQGRTFTPKMSPEQAATLRDGWRRFVDAQRAVSRELRELGIL